MKSVTATELKNQTGRQIEAALTSPVVVNKAHRPVVVLISYEAFQHYQALEDRYWGELAKEASEEGFLTAKASGALLDEMLNAHD
jgi:prevent-host-death family protein